MAYFSFDNVAIDDDIVHLFASYQEMRLFCKFLALQHFTFLRPIFQLIDWSLSWSAFHFTGYSGTSNTFKADAFFSFKLKLWADELSVLSVLQIRHPDFYPVTDLCSHCLLHCETLSHLWLCSPCNMPASWSHQDVFDELISKFITLLAHKLACITKNSSLLILLPCCLASLPCLDIPPLLRTHMMFF